MKISKNGQYALLSVADLAIHAADGHENISGIAARQGIDPRFLGQILFALKNAGIVSGIRGKGGGYSLARNAADITAGEVVRAAEGDLSPTRCCTDTGAAQNCEVFDACITRNLWQTVGREINRSLDSLTIADIAKMYQEGSHKNEAE